MNINDTGKPADITYLRPRSTPAPDQSRGQLSGSTERTAPQASASNIQLSQQAQQLQGGLQVHPGRTDHSFDAQRVAAIRDSIAAGDYHIDPEKLADSILVLERDFGLE